MTFGPFCPSCDGTPYDPVEDTCGNPNCDRHWTRMIDDPDARAAALRAATMNLRIGRTES